MNIDSIRRGEFISTGYVFFPSNWCRYTQPSLAHSLLKIWKRNRVIENFENAEREIENYQQIYVRSFFFLSRPPIQLSTLNHSIVPFQIVMQPVIGIFLGNMKLSEIVFLNWQLYVDLLTALYAIVLYSNKMFDFCARREAFLLSNVCMLHCICNLIVYNQ